MAKNCLGRLGSSTPVMCSMPIVGVKEIYLMHVEDVKPTMEAEGYWSAITFDTGTNSYKIEGYKQNIQVTSAIRSLDASNKLDVSVMFKIPHFFGGSTLRLAFRRALLSGRFYVLVICNDTSNFVIGAQSPLECSGFDWDSNANGSYNTITLTAPDGSSGNYITQVTPGVVATIISKAS